jgi:hypothetical protein
MINLSEKGGFGSLGWVSVEGFDVYPVSTAKETTILNQIAQGKRGSTPCPNETIQLAGEDG